MAKDIGLTLYPTTPIPDLTGLDDDGIVDAMVEWFYANFEDPAHETPYDGREGGFQYIWGGPYEASDELRDAFDTVPNELIERAIEEVEADGITDWAPSTNRVQPEYEDDDGSEEVEPEPIGDTGPLSPAYVRMQDRLAVIEELLNNLEPPPPGLGHNNPPPEAAYLAITAEERDEILKTVADLKATSVIPPNDEMPKTEANVAKLLKYGKKIAAWIKVHIVDKAGDAIGSSIGITISVGAAATLTGLGNVLLEAAQAGLEWLKWLSTIPF
jgi:hypothetical protein